MNTKRIRTYSELILLPTFEERFAYLKLNGTFGMSTFGYDRYINQMFYGSKEWKLFRRDMIIRDLGCDLGIEGRDIIDGIRLHHMNPITIEDFEMHNPDILDPEFVICTSLNTHNAIHYGSEESLIKIPKERRKGDTALWEAF